MSVHFKYVEEYLNEELLPEFDVCETTRSVFSLLRLQCKGKLTADSVRGASFNDKKHDSLCRKALKRARVKNADVFITPEYSIAPELIDEIISQRNLQPPYGKIWCLACQGETVNDFEERVAEWEHRGAHVIKACLEYASLQNFVAPLVYVFRLNNNKICLIPQLKSIPMADRNLSCEGAGLSLGKTIFIFGRNKPNQLCSIICADSMNYEISLVKLFPGNENVILLHPQLNIKPRYPDFSLFRSQIFRNAVGSRCIYITANWAAGTEVKIISSEEVKKITNPWSCIYIKNRDPNWLENLRKLRKANLKKGLGFAYWRPVKVNIWYSCKKENLQFMYIKKPGQNAPAVTQPNLEVSHVETFLPSPDRREWLIGSSLFNEELDYLKFLKRQDPYDCPREFTVEERDIFFGLCLGNMEEGQLTADRDEVCGRLGIEIDDECNEARREAADRFLKLVDCLIKKRLPQYLKHFREDHKMGLEYPFNLFHSPHGKEEKRDQRALVAYVESEKIAEIVAEKFSHLTGNKQSICVFTVKYGSHDIVTYPKVEVSITAGKNFSDSTSIVSVLQEGG